MDEDFGFVPQDDAEPIDADETRSQDPRPVVRQSDTTQIKQEIAKLLTRYPKLVPRTNFKILEKLDGLSDEELENVLINARNDVAEMSGKPGATIFIYAVTKVVDDMFLPGYTDECMGDDLLKTDIENEITELVGFVSNKLNIFYRFISNYLNLKYKNKRAREELSPEEEDQRFNELQSRRKRAKNDTPVEKGNQGFSIEPTTTPRVTELTPDEGVTQNCNNQ